jgi:DNA-binding winged helix-turn-helix (wHTH) protein/TolB-like protein
VNGNFRVGPWLVEPSLNAISRDGTAVHIEPKVMGVLLCLAHHAAEPVLKEKLIQTVWPDTFVTDDVLKRAISELRRVLEDDAREPRIIQTIPKRGYRLVAPVEPVDASGAIATRAPQTPVSARANAILGRKWWMSALAFAALAVVIWSAVRYWPDRESPIDSVAVLPFANNSIDPGGELLGDGITSGLIESLSQIPHLKVMSRSSVFHYKGREIDPRTVGRELHVRALLIGRMVQRGDGFVLDTELVNASDGSHIWGQQFSGKASDVLVIQAELARALSDKLRPGLSSEAKASLAKLGTLSPEAYALYLKGRYFADRWNEQDWKKALEYFQQSVDRDPVYPQAYAGMGEAYAVLAFYRSLSLEEAIQKAKGAGRRALELDGNLAEGHCALGAASFVAWEWEQAEKESRRCVELNPNLFFAHQWRSWILESLGNLEQGLAEQKLALEIDPVSFTGNMFLGETYYWMRDYDRAIDRLSKLIELEPNQPDLRSRLGDCYARKGEYDKAAVQYEEELRVQGKDKQAETLRHAYAGKGFAGLLKAQIRLWSNPEEPGDYRPYDVAGNYSLLGDRGNAFSWLDEAYADNDKALNGNMLPIRVDQAFDNIRSDPRYSALLRRLNFPVDSISANSGHD